MGLLLQRAKTGYLNPANTVVDNLISASNGLMCLANGIFGAASLLNPAMLLEGLATVAAAMIDAITLSVTKVIYDRVNQIIDSVLSPIRQIEGIISDLTATLIGVQNLFDKATNMDNYFKDKQNCSQMAANLLNCLAQSAIDQISNKVAMNVDKHVGKIADSVSKKAMGVNGIISGQVDRHTKFMTKANLQTKLLT